ncbi:MAG: pilus assembly protein PilP [Woeseia sp.]|nr:pilus assembly protein PilP [Woeseia sp.]
MTASAKDSLLVLLVSSVLSSCGQDMADLDSYINEIKARPGGRIEPLPEITAYEVFNYTADKQGLRSPFVPDAPQVANDLDIGMRPDLKRSREYLESFSLDTLRMVGTLQIGDINYGLVQTADGLIHRVLPGNYIGQNDGRISTIKDAEIKLVEIIANGIGGYMEREAALSLIN